MADPLYGFTTLANVFDRRVSEVGVQVVSRAIDAAVAEHNRQMSALTRLFARPASEPKVRYRTPTSARLQPTDESGRARKIRPAGHYEVAFPLQMAAAAWGADFVAREKMTVSEANDYTSTLIMADVRWMRDHILAALFVDGSWNYDDDDDDIGQLVIKGLASGDTDEYLIMSGADNGATDDHTLAQLAAIADATNPYPVIYDELVEHPENAGEVVAFIPSNLRDDTMSLATFHEAPDPNIAQSIAQDRLAASLNVAIPGTLLGYVDKVWVAEWRSLPDDYIVATTTAGERPLGMRQDPEESLRGFRAVAEREDFPFWERQYFRRAGFGVWNRVGAVAYRIGNAAYATPTNYQSPMP